MNELEDRIYGLGPPASRGHASEVNQALGILENFGIGNGGYAGVFNEEKRLLATEFKKRFKALMELD